jgi:two-component system phosphate regulon sensor histidine kinase PhoR
MCWWVYRLLGLYSFKCIGSTLRLKNNDEQFKFHVKAVIGNVAEKLQKQEAHSFTIDTIV